MKPRCGCGKILSGRGKTGMCVSCAVAASNSTRIGSNHPGWKGGIAGVNQLHQRVVKFRGSAKKHNCFFCIFEQAKEWARIHGMSGIEIYHYVPACHACHKHYDHDERYTDEVRLKISNAMKGNQNWRFRK